MHGYLSPVALPGPEATYESPLFEPIDQPHGTVMPDEKLFRQLPNRGAEIRIQRADRQQHLVLLSLKSFDFGRFLAEMQELPNLVPELSQSPVVGQRKILHINIV